jgi:2-methylcitrate dehydratase PrpD
MKVSPADTESVFRLLAATPRRIASLSRDVEISKMYFRPHPDSWSQTVFSFACRIAEHERKHCDQIEAVLKLASAPKSGAQRSARR